MTGMRWTPRPLGSRVPWRELERMRGHMENFFDSVSEGVDSLRRIGAGVYPLINVYEDAENLYLMAELAGVPSEEIDLSIHGDSLTLRGERKIQEADKKVNYHRREREAGFFRRVITLPVKVEAEKATAQARDGVLKVTLPKAVEAKTRQINIES